MFKILAEIFVFVALISVIVFFICAIISIIKFTFFDD